MNSNLVKNTFEKPLKRLCENGGYCSIFRNIICVGDSLASGEFQVKAPDGTYNYHDMFEYSWGQYLARMTGATLYNFTRGGMTAEKFYNNFADENDYWNTNYKTQAYIIALGVNDIFNCKQEVGNVSDYKDDNSKTFAHYYGKIVEKYKKINPNAKIFFVTIPRERKNDGIYNMPKQQEEHAKLIYSFAKEFSNSYVIDLYKYGPVIDSKFKKLYYMNGHMNPVGYAFFGKIIASYIDYIVRHNPKDFDMIGFY